ncbi:MAG: phosphoadenylyl-sulfate reductase [Azospirillaceae bacterium]|nr:phosphoadenylyl-sulfate reductase [Azospirillaceae bacterium]
MSTIVSGEESVLVNEGEALAATLSQRFAGQDGSAVLRPVLGSLFGGRVALVSSFGGEAVVLLALVAEIDPATPVIFLNSGKMFGETLRYRDQVVKRLGLTDVRTVSPEARAVAAEDPDGALWLDDPDACCDLRKTRPLDRALVSFQAWITGRKRHQASTRATLPLFEATADGKIKVNPLASWTRERLEAEFVARDLPRHPLVADGFLSIGCQPCTARVAPDADPRSGRWAGLEKTECGIHLRRAVGTYRTA